MSNFFKHSISICLGSSCFANGNSTYLAQIQKFLQIHNLTEDVELKGSLCQGHCKDGPSIIIDGTYYGHLCAKSLEEILNNHFLNSMEPSHE